MFCRPVILCLLNCTSEINQVTYCRQYFSLGPHVGQPWYILWNLLMCNCPLPPGIISPSVQSIVLLLLVWFHPQYEVLSLSSWYDFTHNTKYCPSLPGMISPSIQNIVPLFLVWFHPQYKALSLSSWYDFTLNQSIVTLFLVWFHPQNKVFSPRLSLVT